MSIFDTVRDSVAAVGVSQKVSYATNTVKLNGMVKSKERDIDMIACAIGREYVKRHLEETGGEFDTQLQSIRDLKAEINQYLLQLDQLKAEQEEAAPRAEGRFCSSCCCANDPNSKFCVHCGKPL